MAPKALYTHERIAAIASRSAAQARAEYTSPLIELLGCEPVLEPDQPLRRAAEVAFRWRFRGAGYDEASEVMARCNNVVERGVPLPEMWATAIRSLSLEEIAQASVEKIRREEPGLSDVSCRLL